MRESFKRSSVASAAVADPPTPAGIAVVGPAGASALLHLLPNPPLEAITLARERGVPGVVRLLLPDTKVVEEECSLQMEVVREQNKVWRR